MHSDIEVAHFSFSGQWAHIESWCHFQCDFFREADVSCGRADVSCGRADVSCGKANVSCSRVSASYSKADVIYTVRPMFHAAGLVCHVAWVLWLTSLGFVYCRTLMF